MDPNTSGSTTATGYPKGAKVWHTDSSDATKTGEYVSTMDANVSTPGGTDVIPGTTTLQWIKLNDLSGTSGGSGGSSGTCGWDATKIEAILTSISNLTTQINNLKTIINNTSSSGPCFHDNLFFQNFVSTTVGYSNYKMLYPGYVFSRSNSPEETNATVAYNGAFVSLQVPTMRLQAGSNIVGVWKRTSDATYTQAGYAVGYDMTGYNTTSVRSGTGTSVACSATATSFSGWNTGDSTNNTLLKITFDDSVEIQNTNLIQIYAGSSGATPIVNIGNLRTNEKHVCLLFLTPCAYWNVSTVYSNGTTTTPDQGKAYSYEVYSIPTT